LSATVSGNLKTLGTAVPGGNPTVRFWLYNTGGNIPRVIGTGVIVPNYVDFVADASGAISGSIYKNSEIDVGGATNTYYHVEFINLTGVIPAADYSITAATFDITTATPITTTATVTPPTGDNTYARLDGGNMPFTAGVSANGNSTVGTGNRNTSVSQATLNVLDGTSSSPITTSTSTSTKATANITRWDGTVQNGAGASSFVLRSELITKAATDVQSQAAGWFFAQVNSTNSVGTANDTNTWQIALGANATALTTSANANVTAINAIAETFFTGANSQTVNGIEVDVLVPRNGAFYASTLGPFAVGISTVLKAATGAGGNGTTGYSLSSGNVGKGWLQGVAVGDAINFAFGVFRSSVTGIAAPDTGIWVSAATTYGVYIGAKSLYATNSEWTPAFDASHNPTIGLALGEKAATSGASHIFRTISTDGASAEHTWDYVHSSSQSLVFQYDNVTKLTLDKNGNLVLSGAGQIFRLTGASSGVSDIQAPATGGVVSTLPTVAGTLSVTIASGTATLGTSLISAGTSATAVTVAATGALTTDSIAWSFNAAPGTGYTAGLYVLAYPTANNVNFVVVNPTAGGLTPAAATLNWRVVR
jgi:hypothetical protein